MPASRFLCISVLALALAACGHRSDAAHTSQQASPTAPSASRGASLFAADCASCHGAAGAGGRIGPVLHDERKRRSETTIRSIIVDPQPPMPKLYPGELSEQDVDDVTAYVERL